MLVAACAGLLLACGPAYRTPALFLGRAVSTDTIPGGEYDVYRAALPAFYPSQPDRSWVSVTGVTIPAEVIDATRFAEPHRDQASALARSLLRLNDTVYVLSGLANSSVKLVPMIDTLSGTPSRWQRVMHRPYPAGLVSFARAAVAEDGQWALVYGLTGRGPVGTGFPRVVLLRREAQGWSVVESHPLGRE